MHPFLRQIDLSYNQLGDDGVRAIARVLCDVVSVRTDSPSDTQWVQSLVAAHNRREDTLLGPKKVLFNSSYSFSLAQNT